MVGIIIVVVILYVTTMSIIVMDIKSTTVARKISETTTSDSRLEPESITAGDNTNTNVNYKYKYNQIDHDEVICETTVGVEI